MQDARPRKASSLRRTSKEAASRDLHGSIAAPEDEHGMAAADDLTVGTSDGAGSALRAKAEVADPASGDVEKTAVDLEAAVADVLGDSHVSHEGLDALLDIQLGHADHALLVVPDGVELLVVLLAQRLQGGQPRVEHAAETRIPQGGRRTAARRVAADDYVPHLQVRNGKLDDGSRVHVCRRDDVGHITVHKDVTGLEAQNCGLGNARVGAPDPHWVPVPGVVSAM